VRRARVPPELREDAVTHLLERGLPALSSATRAWRGYLVTAAKNFVRDRLRKLRGDPRVLLDDPIVTWEPERITTRPEIEEQIRTELGSPNQTLSLNAEVLAQRWGMRVNRLVDLLKLKADKPLELRIYERPGMEFLVPRGRPRGVWWRKDR
jgi:hypothetical protein